MQKYNIVENMQIDKMKMLFLYDKERMKMILKLSFNDSKKDKHLSKKIIVTVKDLSVNNLLMASFFPSMSSSSTK